MAKTDKPFSPPKTLGACADLLFKTREERLQLQKVIEEMESRETALKQHLIDNLPKSKATGVAGKLCRVAVVTKTVPRVESWPDFYARVVADYAARKKKGDDPTLAFAVLRKQLTDSVVNDMWKAGEKVAGVGTFTYPTVSVSKL